MKTQITNEIITIKDYLKENETDIIVNRTTKIEREIKALQENDIKNVIKMNIVNNDIKYDCSGTISLEEYIKNHSMSKKDIIKIIENMYYLIDVIPVKYLIDINSICVDIRFIRVSVENGKIKDIKFIIIPDLQQDIWYELSKSLIKMIRFVDYNGEAAKFLYSLYKATCKEFYTIDDLYDVCKESENSEKAVELKRINNILEIYREDLEFYGITKEKYKNTSELVLGIIQELFLRDTEREELENRLCEMTKKALKLKNKEAK